MKFLYVPEAFISALKAAGVSVDNGEKVDVLTDVVRLSDILSPDNVAFYWYLNVPGNGAIPGPVSASFQPALQQVANPPQKGESTSPKLAAAIDRFHDYSLNGNAPYHPVEGKRLTAALLNEDVIVFTHMEADADSEVDTYDRIVSTLHAVTPFKELAELPLFGHFLAALQASPRA